MAVERDRMSQQWSDLQNQFERARTQNEMLTKQLMENSEAKAIEDEARSETLKAEVAEFASENENTKL